MTLFEGKTPTERNKMIAAGVLGLVSLVALYMAFGPSFGGSTTNATVKVSTKSKPAAIPVIPSDKFKLPSADEEALNITVPVVYRPGNAYAPDAGRNIFAFYEPPPPTPYVATPLPTPIPPKPATPAPTPVFFAGSVNPQSVYAGSRGFRLDVSGDRFTPDARIYFNQTEMPTNFVSPQQLTTSIPDNLIAQEGPRQIIVQTPDGRAYSSQLMMTVQAPPKPTTLQYIGMIGRKRYNNDTAYFIETGKPTPFGARLNDVVAGRFKLIDISSVEVVFEDVTLGFKHRVAITTSPGGPVGAPFNPSQPQGQIPGIPGNIQRYAPPQQGQRPPRPQDKNEDVDDNDIPGGK